MKKIYILIIVLIFIFTLYWSNINEHFTQNEMINYYGELKKNYNKSKKILNKLKKKNKILCNLDNKINKDDINNKMLCYNEIYKEIVNDNDTKNMTHLGI